MHLNQFKTKPVCSVCFIGNMELIKYIRTKLNRKLKAEKYTQMKEEQNGFSAILEGNYTQAKLFIRKANVNTKDINGATVLITVCRNADKSNQHEPLHFVEFLLKKGASVDKLDKHGQSAISYAHANGLTTIKELLIQRQNMRKATWDFCRMQTQLVCVASIASFQHSL